MERCGFATWPVGPTQAEVYERFPDVGRLPPEERKAAELTAAFVDSANLRTPELVSRACRWRPDLVISELMELSGAVAAGRSGARHLVHGVGLIGPGLWATVPAYATFRARWGLDGPSRAPFLDICPPSCRGATAGSASRSGPFARQAGTRVLASGCRRRSTPCRSRTRCT